MFFLFYILIGGVLGLLARVDGDKVALFQPVYTLLFLVLWPIVLVYMIYMTLTHGVIKYKGKEIWRAKRR